MKSPKNDTQKRSFFQDRKMWFWIAAGSGLVTVIVMVIFLQSLISTTKYYVLNTDVPARTLITPDMLQEQVVSSGGEPPTAIDIADITANELYSKASLSTGDILTSSNVGDLMPLRQGIPEDFVVTSFTADPNLSAGGNVKRGDYVDIFYVGDGQASLLFQRILILDTTTDLTGGANEASTTEGAAPATADTATSAYRGGIPSLYTVGVTQNDALKLAAASEGKFYVVLSSAKDVENGAAPKTLGMDLNDVLSSEAGDSGKGTDRFFGEKQQIVETKEVPTSPATSAPSPSSTPSPTQTQAEVEFETEK